MPQGLLRAIGPITLGVVVVGGTVGYYAYHYVTRDAVRLPFWVGFMFSFLAFVVLLVQSVIYAQQAEFMKDQSKAMRDSVERTDKMIENMQGQLTSMEHQEKAMQGQLATMREQAELTKESIELAEKASIYAQRAYVVAKIKDIGDYDDLFQFRLQIENAGNTPANNVCVYYSFEMRDEPPRPMQTIDEAAEAPVRQAIFDTTFDKTERLGVIAPNGGHFIVTTMPPVDIDLSVNGPNYMRWQSGIYRFYCWGTIVYEDIFGKERGTPFCFYQSQNHVDGYPGEQGNQAK
ncbi:MAG TPA: hypothetical protein VJT15_20205 [Pyrinomonadaceae bacterium]|nr:hypothetical protein [Pyrinomonadaceae bacterium]